MSSKNGRQDIGISFTNQKLIDTIVENKLDYHDSNWSPSQSTDDIRNNIFQTAAQHAERIRRSYTFPDRRGNYINDRGGHLTNGVNGSRPSQPIDWITAHQNGSTTNHQLNSGPVHQRLNGNTVQSHRVNGITAQSYRANGNTAQSHRPNGIHPTVQGYLSVARQLPRHTLIPSTGSAFHTPPLRARNGSSEFHGSNGHFSLNSFRGSNQEFAGLQDRNNILLSQERVRRTSQTSPINLSLNRNLPTPNTDSDLNASSQPSPDESRDISRSLSTEDGDSRGTQDSSSLRDQDSRTGLSDQDSTGGVRDDDDSSDNVHSDHDGGRGQDQDGAIGVGQHSTAGQGHNQNSTGRDSDQYTTVRLGSNQDSPAQGSGTRYSTDGAVGEQESSTGARNDQDSSQKHWKKEMVSNITQQNDK